MISSSKNPQVKLLGKLKKQAKYRWEQGLFLVEGEKLVREACRDGQVDRLYLSETWLLERKGDLQEEGLLAWLQSKGYLGIQGNTKVEVLAQSLFSQGADTVTPQGLLALLQIPRYSMEPILAKERLRLVVLEHIADPGNLGAIIRTAEGAGMDGIFLSRDCVDVLSPKVVRSAMGALFRMPFFICQDFTGTLSRLQHFGILLYGAHLKGENIYGQEGYGEKLALVIGNEARGLTPETSKRLDRLVKIPMEGKLESLNASVAAGILMFDIYRRDHGDGGAGA